MKLHRNVCSGHFTFKAPLICAVARAEAGRHRVHPICLTFLLLGVFAGGAGAARADAYLPTIGGPGGSQFVALCPPGQHLTGVELRAGDDIDAIRAVCVESYSPGEISVPVLTTGSGLVPQGPQGQLINAYQVAPGWYGGPGGAIVPLLCPASTPIVLGINVASEGARIFTVNHIYLYCGQAMGNQAIADEPSAIFEAVIDPEKYHDQYNGGQHCTSGQVAIGVHGRYGKWVDAVGLICGPVHLSPRVKSIGRVAVPSSAPKPRTPICEAWFQAASRNSPAAPGLYKQCFESDPPPAKVAGVSVTSRVGAADPSGKRDDPLGNAVFALDDLAAKGAVIASQDPLSVELRKQLAEGPLRRGFDIGMAAAEGDTAPGPGKQKIRESLSPREPGGSVFGSAEQRGFDTAVAFSLERNRNAALAATGAAIAKADPVVAAARTADRDVFYWLGFDIATGLFGDPALGTQGNTALGPGSLAIRDSLSKAGQRGFNASVALHLSRKYR